MKRRSRFSTLIALRLGEEDHGQLEAIADRERTSVSAVIRRFIVEGLNREQDFSARRGKGRGKKP